MERHPRNVAEHPINTSYVDALACTYQYSGLRLPAIAASKSITAFVLASDTRASQLASRNEHSPALPPCYLVDYCSPFLQTYTHQAPC